MLFSLPRAADLTKDLPPERYVLNSKFVVQGDSRIGDRLSLQENRERDDQSQLLEPPGLFTGTK